MKIDQGTVVPTFKPVTLTFETLEELQKFVDHHGDLHCDEVISFDTWDALSDIVDGYSKS